MPKSRPSEAKGGKRKRQVKAHKKTSRMAQLLARAITKDKEMMSEIKDLINKDDQDDSAASDVPGDRRADGRRGVKSCNIPRQRPSGNTPRNVTEETAEVRQHLINSSLSVTTRKSYDRFWRRFTNFVSSSQGSSNCLPTNPDTVSLFIAHLHCLNFAPSTVSSHLSAISYFHQVAGYPDPCNTFIIRRMILGCRKLRSKSDSRLPLLQEHIHLLLQATNQLFLDNRFMRVLYRAIILVSFHGFFRIGELLPAKIAKCRRVMQFQHVVIQRSSIHLQLHFHKTRKTDKPIHIIIPSQSVNCPVTSLKSYVSLRGNSDGPLFISSSSAPITLSNFRSTFNKLLTFSKLSPRKYKLHSFRIGACTQAILSGIPESEVMKMGRWKSHAFKRYIRIPHLKMASE